MTTPDHFLSRKKALAREEYRLARLRQSDVMKADNEIQLSIRQKETKEESRDTHLRMMKELGFSIKDFQNEPISDGSPIPELVLKQVEVQ